MLRKVARRWGLTSWNWATPEPEPLIEEERDTFIFRGIVVLGESKKFVIERERDKKTFFVVKGDKTKYFVVLDADEREVVITDFDENVSILKNMH